MLPSFWTPIGSTSIPIRDIDSFIVLDIKVAYAQLSLRYETYIHLHVHAPTITSI